MEVIFNAKIFVATCIIEKVLSFSVFKSIG